MKLITLFTCLLLPFVTFAHSLDQINYNFDQDEQGKILTIHFTPKGAIDLIVSLKPELKDQSIIKLKSYYDEFTAYFNRTIDVKINKKPIELELIKGDLLSHDATLVYRLKSVTTYEGNVDLNITSYIEIYRRIKNNITLINGTDKQLCFLNKKKTNCSFKVSKTTLKESNNKNNSYYWFGGGLLVVLVILFSLKKVVFKK